MIPAQSPRRLYAVHHRHLQVHQYDVEGLLLKQLYGLPTVFGNGDLVGANNVAGRLQGRGFGDVQILRGGLAGWEKAGGMVGTAYLPEGPGGSAAAGGGW